MAPYAWSLNNEYWPNVTPLMITSDQRVAIEMLNHTMMSHPMHLHGHAFLPQSLPHDDGHDDRGSLPRDHLSILHMLLRNGTYLLFSIFVTVNWPLTRSGTKRTRSPGLTALSIAGSPARNTIVIPSFMSNLLRGPCLIVILPADSSIFVTWPFT